jgi:hypothetical protein
MSGGHSVLTKIDRSKPYFTREVIRQLNGNMTKHVLEIWLPVQSDHGGWLAAVTIDGLNLPDMSAMPGEDPLDALISALKFIRTLFDESGGKFIFDGWNYGKLPKSMDCELAE